MATGSWLGAGNDSVYVKTRCFETFPFPDEDTGLTPELRQRIGVLAEQIDAYRKRQQAASPDLTLTGTYNVLDALREGRPLSAKEKIIHTQGAGKRIDGLTPARTGLSITPVITKGPPCMYSN